MNTPIKFYRLDLTPVLSDFPCYEDDHEGCEGISGPWCCGCECHEVSEEAELRIEVEAA